MLIGYHRPGIYDTLRRLPLFDNLFLSMQAVNVAVVDAYLEDVEKQVLRRYIDEERTPTDIAIFSSALAQMLVFALYELLRTWRQYIRFLIDYGTKLRALKGERRNSHHEKHLALVKKAISGASSEGIVLEKAFKRVGRDIRYLRRLERDLKSTDALFQRLSSLRVNLAKHEVKGQKYVLAQAPGYGRIDMTDGSTHWMVDLGDDGEGHRIMDIVSRRSLADQCRALFRRKGHAERAPSSLEP
jgi:hypothetical protein